ncbi:hypothetical protein CKO_01048 [Citrobacter koseri ATCC BAA-895]|uniref:Uncharacterized protein n=1 Tax=Citrobacter koseri (strain ATCC BAA-895 / CDC 4225-83 / SGSC4696) TaxID=290338 RepID=A8AFC8_CITK8|nr:hypothetical protein CKO_01048 [Citrobacter koseri ATCC BAA-895]
MGKNDLAQKTLSIISARTVSPANYLILTRRCIFFCDMKHHFKNKYQFKIT